MEVDNKGFVCSEAEVIIIVLGNPKVGKTSVISRNYENDFNHVYFPTEGIIRTVSHVKSYGTDVKIIIWDISGHVLNNPASMRKILSCISQSKGIFFVYDVTDQKSFLDISKWMSAVENFCDSRVQRILIGNKAEKDGRVVDKALGEAFANLHQMRFLETSAISKVDTNIKSAFYIMTHDIRKAHDMEFALRFEIEETDSKFKTSRKKRISRCCTYYFLPCVRKCTKK